jgi:hypothetical protein
MTSTFKLIFIRSFKLPKGVTRSVDYMKFTHIKIVINIINIDGIILHIFLVNLFIVIRFKNFLENLVY